MELFKLKVRNRPIYYPFKLTELTNKYSKAVKRLWESDCSDLVSQWMAMKVLFDSDLAHLIHDFWKDKDFNKLTCFLSVGHPDWFAKKTSLNKWKLTDAKSLMPVLGVR